MRLPDSLPPIAWSPARRPPADGGVYLVRDGVTTLHGHPVRVYLLSDGRQLLNVEDVLAAAAGLRAVRAIGTRPPGSSPPPVPGGGATNDGRE